MKPGILALSYLFKFMELGFLLFFTPLMVSECMNFWLKITEPIEETYVNIRCLILIPICCMFAIWNLAHNNLFTNMRLNVKIANFMVGLVCFDAINYATCWCWLKMCCRDQCFTIPTLIKWAVNIVVCGYTAYMVFKFQAIEIPKRLQEPSLEDKSIGDLAGVYLIIYALQWVGFILVRLPIFCGYCCLTACCEKGDDLEDDMIKAQIISFDYCDDALEQRQNFANVKPGGAESQYASNIKCVAKNARIREEETLEKENDGKDEEGENCKDKLVNMVKAKIAAANPFSKKENEDCALCGVEGKSLSALPCNDKHKVHSEC
jgi:hypothetical protein